MASWQQHRRSKRNRIASSPAGRTQRADLGLMDGSNWQRTDMNIVGSISNVALRHLAHGASMDGNGQRTRQHGLIAQSRRSSRLSAMVYARLRAHHAVAAYVSGRPAAPGAGSWRRHIMADIAMAELSGSNVTPSRTDGERCRLATHHRRWNSVSWASDAGSTFLMA